MSPDIPGEEKASLHLHSIHMYSVWRCRTNLENLQRRRNSTISAHRYQSPTAPRLVAYPTYTERWSDIEQVGIFTDAYILFFFCDAWRNAPFSRRAALAIHFYSNHSCLFLGSRDYQRAVCYQTRRGPSMDICNSVQCGGADAPSWAVWGFPITAQLLTQSIDTVAAFSQSGGMPSSAWLTHHW